MVLFTNTVQMLVKVLWLSINIAKKITGATACFLPLLMSLCEEHCADVRLIVFVNVSTLICHKLDQQGSCHF